jgi:hypothetical protein
MVSTRALRALLNLQSPRTAAPSSSSSATSSGAARDDELVALDPDAGWPEALDAYFAEHDDIGTGPDARSAARILIEEGAETWKVRQIIDDPAGDHDWGIEAEVDLAASADEGVAVVRVLGMTRL